MPYDIKVNGVIRTRGRRWRHAGPLGPARRAGHDRHQVRLRQRPVRRLHGPRGRQCHALVHHARSGVGRRDPTIEAIGNTPAGQALQKAWLDLEVVQCGYCQSGADHVGGRAARLQSAPSDEEIDNAMSGNICRCGTYLRIREAIKLAARSLARTEGRLT